MSAPAKRGSVRRNGSPTALPDPDPQELRSRTYLDLVEDCEQPKASGFKLNRARRSKIARTRVNLKTDHIWRSIQQEFLPVVDRRVLDVDVLCH